MDRLILFISSFKPTENITGFWVVLRGGGSQSDLRLSEFSSLAALKQVVDSEAQAEVHALLPGEFCSTLWVELPKKGREALKTVPFQIEPYLTSPIEKMHFSPLIKIKSEDNKHPVWCCEKSWLQAWMTFFIQSNVPVKTAAPDYSILWNGAKPFPNNTVHKLSLSQRTLVAGSINGAGKTAFIEALIQSEKIENSAEVQLTDLTNGAFLDASLLTGQFKKTQRDKNRQRPHIKWAAVAAGVVLLTNLLLGYMEGQRMEQALKKQNSEIIQAFQKALPGQRMVDPEFQLQQELYKRRLAAQPSKLSQSLSEFSTTIQNQQTTVTALEYSSSSKQLSISYQGQPLVLPNRLAGAAVTHSQDIQGESHRVLLAW